MIDMYIGIDLGTSSVKLLLVDKNGEILNSVTNEYPIYYPKSGWSEQNPEDWLASTLDGIDKLLENTDRSLVKGVSFGGQMHGLVILDENDRVIRPAILWNDGRTAKQTEYLNEVIGKQRLSEYTANIAFAGFTAPKILWVKENEPENFEKIAKIMLPKDYLAYMLTGTHSCDYSDASGMLLLDVKNKCWSKQMCDICGVDEKWLPGLYESFEVIGKVKKEFDLPYAIVTAGAGDNAAAAIGTGAVKNGDCNISLGTSGTVFIAKDAFSVDENNSLHSFAHADGKYHLMGCILSAASCNKWWMEDILCTKDFSKEQDGLDSLLGENDVFFLPYLMGERSPINDTNARGTFIGMTMDTTRADMVQAVLEGVAFAIRDSVEVARSLGIQINSSKICGGGVKSKLWQRIFANVLNCELEIPVSEQGPGMGGAMLAMVACGEYDSVKACCQKLCAVAAIVKPELELVVRYEARYQQFKKIYPACKELFAATLSC